MKTPLNRRIKMTEKKTSNITVVQQEGGVVRNILNQLKLIFRLMGDRRVNFLAKLIPLGALVYLFSPLDAIYLPFLGPVDDAALLWLGSYIFTELCPPEVVAEHMKALNSNLTSGADSDVVDGEATDVKE
jgi:uncharacterized membrane protein YkvA (DUF1232 family)